MMPASKHGDPQLGIDIHLCVVPPSPAPVPLPTPHTSIVFDPFDYVPIIGATVTVCGMKRANAGTNGIAIHIPPGFPFAPKLPDKDDELFMGSATVAADGDPFSYLAVPVLSCQIVGMMSPFRPKKKGGRKAMVLPTVFNLAIPTTVFVGGPPTISAMGMAFKGAFAALGKFAKPGLFKRFRQELFKKLDPGFLKCVILRAEPVNILTGEVSVEHEDFSLPGRIPIEWTRSYASGCRRNGLCGYGWETPADTRLEVDPTDGSVSFHHPKFGPLLFARMPASLGAEGAQLELRDGAVLTDHRHDHRVRTKDDRIYYFPKRLARVNDEGSLEYPIGRIADLCGNWLDFQRDADGLIGIRESSGRGLTIRVDGGHIREISLAVPGTDARHTFVRYEYDGEGDLAAAFDALGNPYRFAYDAHHMVRHTTRTDLSFHYEYDEQWRVTKAWGDGGLYAYRFEYIDVLNERRITDSLGGVSIVALDDRGLPISEIDPLGGRTVFEYDDAARTTAIVDPAGRRTEYAYDPAGNLIALLRPDGTAVTVEFDANNKAVAVRDPNGAEWTQTWEERGLLIEQATPLGHVSRYEYDARGQLVATTNPRGARTKLAFDAVGNVVGITNALGHLTIFDYDALGNVTRRIDPLQRQTSFRYDAKSRIVATRLPSGATVQNTYDAADHLVRQIDELGAETLFEYVGVAQLARRLQPDGQSVEFFYDTEERIVGVRNQRGEVYRLERDPIGRIVEEIDYWGQSRRYAYDAGGHLRASIDPLERRVAYATDALGRIVKKTLSDGQEETFGYDANGNLVETANAHGSVRRTFGRDGQMVSESQGAAFTIAYAYDPAGNRISRTTSLGAATTYEFDPLDQPVSVTVLGSEPIRLDWDAAGQLTHEALTPHVLRRLRYNADGILTEQAVAAHEMPLFATHFDYDRGGNLVRRGDSHFGIETYVYDPMERIVEHTDPHGRLSRFLGDAVGDLLRTRVVVSAEEDGEASHDGDAPEWRREGNYGGTHYAFDRAGNLVARVSAERSLDFVWDANQRLSASRSNGRLTRYGYDPLGRRVFKEEEGVRTLFFWDGDALAGEATAYVDGPMDSRVREYVYYPDTFTPLALVVDDSGDRQIFHYHNDPNGCPTRLTDASGAVRWAASYGPNGGIARLHVADVENPIRLQGQYFDAELGLHYNCFRYYDPECRLYITQDPLRLEAGSNLYLFAPNIFGWIDPYGLTPEPTGTYTIVFSDGTKYHGKGPESRMKKSAKRELKVIHQLGDTSVTIVDSLSFHTVAASAREAFIEEARRIAADGGLEEHATGMLRNRINSPGKKYLKDDLAAAAKKAASACV